MRAIGIQALAVSVPDRVLTNEHWRQTQPELVARAEERIWMWKPPKDWSEGSEPFNRAMAPYLYDPFRGAKLRRRLPPQGSALSLEADAARQALDAAGLGIEDVDLLICSSFLPDSVGIGGAAFLARELGLEGAAWNLETACSSATVAFQTACGLIQAGQHKRALVVTSCTYSRVAPDDDPVSWGVGDAATALVVGEVAPGTGYLGGHTVHSAATCGAVAYELDHDRDGRPYFHLKAGRKAAQRLLRETAEPYLKTCTFGALEKAGLELDDLDFFVFNTPLAWSAAFSARVLGIAPERTISIYPLYANVGPALTGLNLFHAAAWGRIRPQDRVLIYSVGSVSSCSAAIVRWGDVALGAVPAGVTPELLAALEAEPLPGPVERPIADVA
ncbi:MAG: 3-oxoacyl-ACP synthase [Acidobacteria bacterium]|nr:MAG: 3-oxoacyl-ACP synthase [Acidobacteriota bacterium]